MLNIAHRGASGHVPENTHFSIETAITCGADIIEVDLQLTKDKQIVLFHDRSFQRLDGDPKSVSDYNLDELEKKNFGGFIPGYTLPPVVLPQILHDFNLEDFVLELKPLGEKGKREMEVILLDTLDDYDYNFNHGYLSVRDVETMSALNDMGNRHPVGVMQKNRTAEEFIDLCDQSKIKIAQIRRLQFNQVNVKLLKNVVQTITAYPADNPGVWREMIDWDVDGLLTNYPAALKTYLTRYLQH